MKIYIWFNLFYIAILGGKINNVGLLILSIIASYYFLKFYPVFKNNEKLEDK